MTEHEFAQAIYNLGGRAYIVGGWIRDKLRNQEAKDKDYMICGVDETVFCKYFSEASKVGKSFPVYLLNIDDAISEVSFARKEVKTGIGYTGFTVSYNKDITLEEDLYRRDTRMNAIAYDILNKTFIDPYNGIGDIRNQCIDAISEHFCEDPVRALRAARQACELGFEITDYTLNLMERCREEISCEPEERLFNELKRALGTPRPSIFFRYLQKTNLLEATFPEIFALIGKTQPVDFHPEGDAFEHTMQIVDFVAELTEDLPTRFAGLVHDIGKGVTPLDMLPHHYGHEHTGTEVLDKWNKRMPIPKHWVQSANFVITSHMKAARLTKPGKIVDLLLAIERCPIGIEGFNAVILADSKFLPYYLADYHSYIRKLHNIDMRKCPATLKGAKIGDWLRQERIRQFQLNEESIN